MSSESINIARWKRGSDVFEVVIEPEKAIEARKNPAKTSDALVYPKIFSDAKKGMMASEQRLIALFKTADPLEVAKHIIQEGTVQLNAEYRQKLLDQKKRQVIEMIHRNGIDPKTGAPHPVTRIETALQEAKVKIDEFKSAEAQMQQIVKQLAPIIPIKIAIKEVEITIPAEFASKTYSTIKMMSKVLKENWNTDGSWTGHVEIPGGIEQEFYEKLNKIAHGQVQSKMILTR